MVEFKKKTTLGLNRLRNAPNCADILGRAGVIAHKEPKPAWAAC